MGEVKLHQKPILDKMPEENGEVWAQEMGIPPRWYGDLGWEALSSEERAIVQDMFPRLAATARDFARPQSDRVSMALNPDKLAIGILLAGLKRHRAMNSKSHSSDPAA